MNCSATSAGPLPAPTPTVPAVSLSLRAAPSSSTKSAKSRTKIRSNYLRVLESHEFQPLGDPQVHRADVRIIAATNRDLEDAVATGAFRQDLYYRLNVIPIDIPPLRQRQEDIPVLVEMCLDETCRAQNKPAQENQPGSHGGPHSV